jgi:hypothetical protein
MIPGERAGRRQSFRGRLIATGSASKCNQCFDMIAGELVFNVQDFQIDVVGWIGERQDASEASPRDHA